MWWYRFRDEEIFNKVYSMYEVYNLPEQSIADYELSKSNRLKAYHKSFFHKKKFKYKRP